MRIQTIRETNPNKQFRAKQNDGVFKLAAYLPKLTGKICTCTTQSSEKVYRQFFALELILHKKV